MRPDEPAANRQQSQAELAVRSALIWLVLIIAEIAHGTLRMILLVPRVGKIRSDQIGVFTGSAIILIIACLTIRWIGAARFRELLLTGAIWLALTVAFEILFGRFVMGLSWKQLAANYNMLEGGLMPLGLLILLFAPWMATKVRGLYP